MTWGRLLPLFVWSHYATSLIMVLGTPVLAISLALIMAERLLHVGIFDPGARGRPHPLPAPVLVLLPHPAVYIMVLPAMGGGQARSSPCFVGRRPIFGYRFMAEGGGGDRGPGLPRLGPPHVRQRPCRCYAGDGLLDPQLPRRRSPRRSRSSTGRATMYKGSHPPSSTPMLYALGFVGLFTMGRADGPDARHARRRRPRPRHLLRRRPLPLHHGRRGGDGATWAGIHFWWPKMSGRMYPERLKRLLAA